MSNLCLHVGYNNSESTRSQTHLFVITDWKFIHSFLRAWNISDFFYRKSRFSTWQSGNPSPAPGDVAGGRSTQDVVRDPRRTDLLLTLTAGFRGRLVNPNGPRWRSSWHGSCCDVLPRRPRACYWRLAITKAYGSCDNFHPEKATRSVFKA